MALFWKTTAGVLVAVVLVLAVGKQERDLALLLTMAACILAVTAGFSILEPVLDFLYRLEKLGDLQSGVLGILLKITGIGLVGEITEMICRDSGNASLARGMQLLVTAVILSQSLPILETVLELIQTILGGL